MSARFSHISSHFAETQNFDDIHKSIALPRIQIARMLLAAGWDFENLLTGELDITSEILENLRYVTGAALIAEETVTDQDYNSQSLPRFGKSNPQEVSYTFWKEMIRTGNPGYWAHEKYLPDDDSWPRLATWSFDRFGMTTTRLPDGRWVQIAGEHEDSYDPDFNIYNDVILHDGDGGVRIFTYPEEVFPPTDFHTATLIGDHILVIGNLSYQGKRHPGETQVLRLNLRDFSIETVKTSGSNPGWINRHTSVLAGGEITVFGGEIQKDQGKYGDYKGRHTLRLIDMVWRKLE